MKHFILAVGLTCALSTAAYAQEVFADPAIADGLATVPAVMQDTLNDCLSDESSSRAIRACSKAINASIPNSDIRSQLYIRRALHKMALGRFDGASMDFARAGELSGNADLTALGQGFSAMFSNDLDEAEARFAESQDDTQLAPLAHYGLGMTHHMAGEADEARAEYDRALTLRPDWQAVKDKKATLEK
jgi:tetratricopeptide (TPR) repeat protein